MLQGKVTTLSYKGTTETEVKYIVFELMSARKA